jgi:hypothetical protein
MPRNLRFFNLLMVFVLAGLSMLTSCGHIIPTGYRTYSLPDNGVSRFSFDYPARFNIRQEQLRDNPGFERVDLDGPYSRQARDRTTIWVVAQHWYVAATVADRLQAALTAAKGLPGYLLMDRSAVTAGGIPAEQIVYFYYSSRTDYETKVLGFKPSPTVTRQVFFTYNNLFWTVGMRSCQDTADSGAMDFEHVLQTLQMLP